MIKFYTLKNVAFLLLIFFIGGANIAAQTTRYVKQGGTGNGTTWALASGDVQATINASAANDQVWVAAGNYQSAPGPYFSMKSSVKIYGGFPPTGSPGMSGRNPDTYPTSLIGNGSRVLLNADVDNVARLDGFYIWGGSLTGSDSGAGMLNSNSSPVIANCFFTNNTALQWGGAIYNTGPDTHAQFINCVIFGNSASGGGGIFDHNFATPVYTNCTITGNTSTQNGGGIHTYENAASTLNNCIVWNNDAAAAGDELCSVNGGAVTGLNCVIANDSNDITGSLTGTPISSDPLFASGIGNFRLQLCSPAINAGNNSYIPAGMTTDIGGLARLYNNGTIDIGAYEYQGNPVAAPTAAAAQFISGTATVAGLFASGQSLRWYAVATGGTSLPGTTPIPAGTYYVSQTVDGCESPRTAVVATVFTSPVIYVKKGQAGSGNSWANALGEVADALKLANSLNTNSPGAITQIWVAGGTYKPMYAIDNINSVASENRQNTFVVLRNVNLYGGFAGTETALTERNIALTGNASILSGDYGTADTYNATGLATGGNTTNAYHVVAASGNVGTASIDGFTIVGGNANGQTAYVLNESSVGSFNGGGLYCSAASLQISNIIFKSNYGLYGGGFYGEHTSQPQLTNVLFTGNNGGSGGAITLNSCNPFFTNVTITANTASDEGGAMFNSNCSPLIRNSVIWNNTKGAAINNVFNSSANPIYNYTLLQGGGTSNYNSNSDPMFTDPANGNYTLQPLSPAINAGNTVLFDGAATAKDLLGNPRVYSVAVDMGAYETQNIPPAANAQAFCELVTVANLVAAGTDVKWYVTATGGTALADTTPVATATYYVSQTMYTIESARTAVAISVQVTPAPITSGEYVFMPGASVAALSVTGTGIKWYSAATGGMALAYSAPLTTATYYASQTVDGCEGPRTAVVATLFTTHVLYVKKGQTGNGSSWGNALGELADALKLANSLNPYSPGAITQIWVAGGTYKPMYAIGDVNIAVFENRRNTFGMMNNVSLYGGFAGTETALTERNTALTGNASILSGDYGTADTYNATGLVTGGNTTNAYHVVAAGGNMGTASIDGFTIVGGNANNNITVADLNGASVGAWNGGGMYCSAASPEISNIIFKGNYGSSGGGFYAVFSQSTLTNVLFTGNTASFGGAICTSYSGPLLTNVTITSNVVSNDGGAIFNGASDIIIQNSVIWNNKKGAAINNVFNSDTDPVYNYTLLQGGATTNNNSSSDPMFTDPANGNYTLQQISPAVNAGNTAFFAGAATAKDLLGNRRVYSAGIDMGAYEFKMEDCTITTIWNGTEWSDGVPAGYEYSAGINGNFNSAEDGNITACSLTVNSGDVVIGDSYNFIIKESVTVDNENASLTIQHNGSLLQADDVDNIGTITVIKESAPMYRLDYSMWASPVAGQKLKAFSPETLDNRFYSYNPLSDAYATVAAPATTDFTEGKSYLIRVSNTHPAFADAGTQGTPWQGVFTGIPNNGDVDVATIGMADEINGYNAVGNPYPSSINIAAFFEANQNNLAEDTPIYFWRKKNDAGTSSYCSLTLAGYNKNTGNAFGDSSNGVFDNPDNSENWVINSGQGFIVQATGSTVTFNNEMRVGVSNSQMFRTAMEATDKSRLWLNLTNTDGAFGQATIAYTQFTTLGRDFGWDGKALSDGDIAIYSLAGENKFGIQARPAFDVADEVPMEYKVTNAGTYTISLDHFDGIFAEGQGIYLRDNVLGSTHNMESPYEFTTEAGIMTGRFDVVYAMPLDTDIPAFNSNSIIVYKQGSTVNISTGNVDIKSVAVYDIRGRLLYSSNDINAAITSINGLQAQEQMLIIEVMTTDGLKANRKIVF